jgi:threonine dehydrogenase-like Zn-dependent dehydrogenase
VRAVVFDLSIPRYVAAKALGKRIPALYDGLPSCIGLRDDVAEPALPGDDWVRLRPLLAGVCGSDLAAVYFKASAALTPYATYPFVPGHEVLGVVVDRGRAVKGIKEGDRVAVDPWIRCDLRDAPLCTRCEAGEYATCERAGTGPRRGMMIGASADLPGGWGEEMVAHQSQCFALPASVSDDRGVLVEPVAVAVHAVLRNAPRDGARVLVLGGGAIAYAVVFALREAAPPCDVTVYTLDAAQAKLAEALGADRGWTPGGEPLVDRAARLTGATPLSPEIGPRYLAGGFDLVFDCVGSARSLADALALARAGSRIVMVGAAGVLPKIDLTHLWTKELALVGTLAYCWEEHRGQRRRTFDIARELLEGSSRPIERLVTHRYPLPEFRAALRANLDRGASGAVKTVLTP